MWPELALAAGLAGTASALLVADGSSCSQYCGNTLSNTTTSDMTCTESDYSSSAAGIVFENCINCELTSDYYTSDNETDLQWLLYNVRYAVSYCFFGYPSNPDLGDSPCITSTACGPLLESVEWNNLTTDTGAYDYCVDWSSTQVTKCAACLEAAEDHYINNFFTILEAACEQEPVVGSTLSVEGAPFSTVKMNVTTPSSSSLYTYTPAHSAISLGGKVGIAIGGIVFLLFLAGVAIVCVGRRRRKAYLRTVAERYGQSGWPSQYPGVNTHDTFDTPMSQKPLRGWDNSPTTGSADGQYPRYFSPYNSQFNSPVSATDTNQYTWPTVAQMSEAQANDLHYDPGVGSSSGGNAYATGAGLAAGMAMAGADQGLHSKNSGLQTSSEGVAAAATSEKGKEYSFNGEAYELREIDSNGTPSEKPATTDAPILQHPGYGRGNLYAPPPAHPPTLYHGGPIEKSGPGI